MLRWSTNLLPPGGSRGSVPDAGGGALSGANVFLMAEGNSARRATLGTQPFITNDTGMDSGPAPESVMADDEVPILESARTPAGRTQTDILNTNEFAPRAGIAHPLSGKTTIRGGYGMFWAPIPYGFQNTRGYSQTTAYMSSVDSGSRRPGCSPVRSPSVWSPLR